MEVSSYYDRGRISNIVWTITDKYGYEVDFSLIEQDYFSYELIYNATIIGSVYNILDYKMIADFIKSIKEQINKAKEILTLFFMCIEETCINKNIEFIKNIENIRYENYKYNIKILSETGKKDKLYNMLRLAYWHNNTDKIMIFPHNIIHIIRSIGEFKTVDNTIDFIEKFKKIINLYFKFEEDNIKQNIENAQNINEKTKSAIAISIKNNKEKIYEFFEEYTSSEFNPNESIIEKNFSTDSSTIDEKEDISKEEENLKKMENYYGKTMFDINKLHILEKKYCKDIHHAYKLFFTKGDLSSIKEDYRKNQIEQEQNKNKYEYMSKKEYYDRSIEKLKSIIKQSLAQNENVKNKSYSGNVDARLIYKAEKINDYKIFWKEKRRDEIKFLVDIVIDSSASLLEKQSKLSVQAYIISKALEDLKIENSIKTFNSFMDYTVIKILKDYDDMKSENCFDYFCSGGNRDGLAIDVIGSMSNNMSDYKKMMIIFTDAKPFDVQILHAIGTKAKKPYQGDIAIDDTANVIRKLRQKNTKVCGIFSGQEEDIGIIRYIYGSDFLHINSVEQLSTKVGRFISDYISNFYE